MPGELRLRLLPPVHTTEPPCQPELEPERLVADYLAYLNVKKGRPRCKGHIDNTRHRLTAMFAGVERLEDLTPERIEARLVELLEEDVVINGKLARRSRQTVNFYRQSLGTFYRWLIRKRRLVRENPVEFTDALEPEDQRRVTRPFSPAEASRFLASVPRNRLALYALWSTCGLRPGETRRLLVGHVVLAPVDGSPPYLQILRSTSKNRRAVRQPLHPEAAHLVAPLLIGKRPDEPVFPCITHWISFRRDLKRAGLPTTAGPEGGLSRTSLRKLFATSLDRQGESEGLVQKLMRHSTPELTRERYTHYELTEKASAVGKLEYLPPTDGKALLIELVNAWAPHVPYQSMLSPLRRLARRGIRTPDQLTDDALRLYVEAEGLKGRARGQLLRTVKRFRAWLATLDKVNS